MDKLSKSVLHFMVSMGAGRFCSLDEGWDDYADVSIKDLSESIHADQEEVRAAITYLVGNNLAEYRVLSSKSGPVRVAFCLKHEGLHFKEFKRLTRREKWKERLYGFISGVLVTVLGGLLIKWLAG